MKKALLALLSVTLLVTIISPAQAEDQKVLAIIDTAINSEKNPEVIHEACITTSVSMGCSNGKTFMEGKGAASAPWPASINNVTYHGEAMVKAALTVNPNVKILFVRYADVNALGNSLNQPETLIKAIEWVSQNAEKYSVDAVSISQASISAGNLARCTSSTSVINAVSSLNSKNIPTFASTGNDGSLTAIGFPSCVNGVTAVGALSSLTAFEKASNRGPGIDAVSLGRATITKYNGSVTDVSGTSVANVTAAASYLKNSSSNFSVWFQSLTKLVVNGLSYSHISK